MAEKFDLGIADIAIFCVTLIISAGIGIYFRFFGGKQQTNDEYLLAGKNMPIYPVAFSLMATFMSATTLMGIPAEMYVYGTHMIFMNLGFLLGPLIASYVFLPIYFDTGVSTSYEYLERRFGRTSRRILSFIFLIQNVLFNGVSLYAPALALSAVTNLSMWTSVISIGTVCTFYCTLGGMKAVLWSDVFQAVLMYTCLLAIAIKACVILGLSNIFEIAYGGGRLVFPTFSMDFSTRYTMWSVLFQGLLITVNSYSTSQIQIQRQLTVRNIRRARIANIVSGPMISAFHLLCCLAGIIFYAYFQSCDPMQSTDRPIQSPDQLLPYFIVSAMRDNPGLPGLCIAGIFSASLSTISSAVNSMAAVTYEDIIKPLFPRFSDSVVMTKFLSLFYGILTILIVYVTMSLGTLVKASVLVVGMVAGPSLGVYMLAVFSTIANEEGAITGTLAAILFTACATFVPNERFYEELPVSSNCSTVSAAPTNASLYAYGTGIQNGSSLIKNTSFISSSSLSYSKAEIYDNFPVSYMWISTFSLVICLIVGYCTSWIVRTVKGRDDPVQPILLSPVRKWFFRTKQGSLKSKLPSEKIFTITSSTKLYHMIFNVRENRS